MPAFIANSRGVMVQVPNAPGRLGPQPFTIKLDAFNITGPSATAIITQAMIRQDSNVQFIHTLDDSIFVYVFGDKIGEARVSGLCFSTSCDGDGNGVQNIIRRYRELRVAKTPLPTQMMFGGIAYKVFLTGMSIDIVDADQNIGQWGFRFKMVDGDDG